MTKSSKEILRAQQLAEGLDIDPRHEIVAAELVKGSTREASLLKAGYSEKTARHGAKSVVNGKGVRAALIRIAESLSNKDLGQMAKGKLVQILEEPGIEPRTIIQAIRMAGEWAGEIGQAREMNINLFQQQISPSIMEALKESWRELQKENAITVEVEDAAPQGHQVSLQEGN